MFRRTRPRRSVVFLTTVSIALVATSAAAPSRAVHSRAAAELPTAASARSIVGRLWALRESAFASLDRNSLDSIESRSAKLQDERYVASVLCGCEPEKGAHAADRIVPQIPRASVESVFFAEVGTRDDNGKRVWYVVAVERAGGDWKLAYVTFGGYKSAPPLRAYTRSDNYTVPVTSASTTRMQHLVGLSVKYARTHNPLVDHTSYGAVIHTRFLVRPSKDGSFGLSLASGDVLSCYTLHAIDTYTVSSQGLQQGASRTQWGHLLRPGIYRSITIDTARPVCVAGTGVGSKAVVVRLSYDPRVVAESGVRL